MKKNVLMGDVRFGQYVDERREVFDQAPSEGRTPSSGNGQKVSDGNVIVETDLGTGPQVETKVDTKTKGEGGADEFKDKYENKTQPGDDTPADPPTTETPSAPNYLMIAGGLALLYFLFKRKRK